MSMQSNDRWGWQMVAHQHRCTMYRGALVMRLMGREMRERARAFAAKDDGSPAGTLDAALTALESDLSYLEDLPAESLAPLRPALDGMDERVLRVVARLPDRPR
jgi:hypothetical protein